MTDEPGHHVPVLLVPILLVEDSATTVLVVRDALRELPVHILHVATLGAAIAELTGAHYELVLLDMNLADSSGLYTVRKVATLHETIVVLSASVESALETIAEGADDFVPKGSRPDQIRHAVQCALERRWRKNRVSEKK